MMVPLLIFLQFSVVPKMFLPLKKVLQIRVVPNIQSPRLSEARVLISNHTVPTGSRADEGLELVLIFRS